MRSKAARFLFAFATIGFSALSACMTAPDARDPDSKPTTELTSQINDEIVGSRLCCITYTCPTDPEIEFTGCKAGNSGPGGAFRACETACGQICDAGELVCE